MAKINIIIRLLTEIAERLRILGYAKKDIFSIEEVTEVYPIGKARVYQATREKELPFYRQHGRVYFKKEDLENWVLQNRIASKEEIETKALNHVISNS